MSGIEQRQIREANEALAWRGSREYAKEADEHERALDREGEGC
jgi:hypothetical protein